MCAVIIISSPPNSSLSPAYPLNPCRHRLRPPSRLRYTLTVSVLLESRVPCVSSFEFQFIALYYIRHEVELSVCLTKKRDSDLARPPLPCLANCLVICISALREFARVVAACIRQSSLTGGSKGERVCCWCSCCCRWCVCVD